MKMKEQSECTYRGFQHDEWWVDRKAWRVEENHELNLVEHLANLVLTGAVVWRGLHYRRREESQEMLED